MFVHRCANYGTVRHAASLLVRARSRARTHTHTHTQVFGIEQYPVCVVHFPMVIDVFTFLSLFDKRRVGYCSFCHLEVID